MTKEAALREFFNGIPFIACNPHNYGKPRRISDVLYLVFHYTGNDGDHDTANAVYYRDNALAKPASAHYFVDDDSITQSVGDLTVAYAVGGSKWSDCAQTGGGTLYGIVTNTNSISIEMCDTVRDGTYNVTEATLANALKLGAMLMIRYGIPIERVVRHFDVTGKYCPQYFMDAQRWAAFKEKLQATVEELEDKMDRFDSMAEIKQGASWAAETVSKLCDKGIIRGSGAGVDDDGKPTDMDLSRDMLRLLVMNDRAGVYGE